MANLFIRTYTFVDGTTAYGSQVEAEVGNIVTILNNLNAAVTAWGQVSILHATNVPLIADCFSGTQHIADFKNNSVIKASVSSAGLLTAAGATVSGTADFTGQLKGKGTATNDSAAAGYIGEYIEGIAGSTSVTTGQYVDLSSIALTPGDWDVTGIIEYSRNAATFTSTDFECGISSTSGNSGAGLTAGVNYVFVNAVVPTSFSSFTLSIPVFRVSISSNTTYFLKAYAEVVSAGTAKYQGRISARRIR